MPVLLGGLFGSHLCDTIGQVRGMVCNQMIEFPAYCVDEEYLNQQGCDVLIGQDTIGNELGLKIPLEGEITAQVFDEQGNVVECPIIKQLS